MGKNFFKTVSVILMLPVIGIVSVTLADSLTVPVNQAEIKLSFAPIVRRTGPAVVNIYAQKVVEQRRGWMFNDPFFRRFFGDEFSLGGGPKRSRIENSLGSGVIVRSDGIVVKLVVNLFGNRCDFGKFCWYLAQMLISDEMHRTRLGNAGTCLGDAWDLVGHLGAFLLFFGHVLDCLWIC